MLHVYKGNFKQPFYFPSLCLLMPVSLAQAKVSWKISFIFTSETHKARALMAAWTC